MKIGINGFGRIGRLAFRAAVNRDDVEIVGINDLVEPDYLAYMLQYDSTHGRFDGTVAVKDGNLVVNGKTIRVTAERDPANLKWGDLDTDVVLECTGLFLTQEAGQKHLDAGAKKSHFLSTGQRRYANIRPWCKLPHPSCRPKNHFQCIVYHQLCGSPCESIE